MFPGAAQGKGLGRGGGRCLTTPHPPTPRLLGNWVHTFDFLYERTYSRRRNTQKKWHFQNFQCFRSHLRDSNFTNFPREQEPLSLRLLTSSRSHPQFRGRSSGPWFHRTPLPSSFSSIKSALYTFLEKNRLSFECRTVKPIQPITDWERSTRKEPAFLELYTLVAAAQPGVLTARRISYDCVRVKNKTLTCTKFPKRSGKLKVTGKYRSGQ